MLILLSETTTPTAKKKRLKSCIFGGHLLIGGNDQIDIKKYPTLIQTVVTHLEISIAPRSRREMSPMPTICLSRNVFALSRSVTRYARQVVLSSCYVTVQCHTTPMTKNNRLHIADTASTIDAMLQPSMKTPCLVKNQAFIRNSTR